MILYALLCGTLPFDDENIPNLFKKIKVLSIVLRFSSMTLLNWTFELRFIIVLLLKSYLCQVINRGVNFSLGWDLHSSKSFII